MKHATKPATLEASEPDRLHPVPNWSDHPAVRQANNRLTELSQDRASAQSQLTALTREVPGRRSEVEVQALQLIGTDEAKNRLEKIKRIKALETQVIALNRAIEIVQADVDMAKANAVNEMSAEAWEEGYLPLAREAARAYLSFVKAATKAKDYRIRLGNAGLALNRDGIPLEGIVPGTMLGGNVDDVVAGLIRDGFVDPDDANCHRS